MSRKSDDAIAAEAAARAELAEIRAALVEQDARHEIQRQQDRHDRELLMEQFRQELSRGRLEAVQQQAQLETPPAPPAPAAPPQPRDEHTGRWVPAEPQQEQPEPVDLADMSMDQYAAYRQQFGMDQRGIDNLGRAPGHEVQSFRGHDRDDGSGFADWRDYASGNRVFNSQLPDNRRPVPPGYARSAEQSEQYR